MLTKQKHIVKKQVYNISVLNQQNSQGIHRKISDINISVVLPLIDKACCELDTNGTNIRIDKFEIDIGDLNVEEIDAQIKEVFYSKFYEKLSQEIAHHVFYEQKDGLIVKTLEHTTIEKVEHYLITGLLPWWHSKDEEFDIVSELDIIVNGQPDEIKKIFLNNFNDTRFIRRLSYILTPLKLKYWLDKLYPNIAKSYSDFLDDLSLIDKHREILNSERQQTLLIETLLSLLFTEKEMLSEDDTVVIVQNLLLTLCDNNYEKYAEIITLPAKITSRFASKLSEIINQLEVNLLDKNENVSLLGMKTPRIKTPLEKPETEIEEKTTLFSTGIKKEEGESSTPDIDVNSIPLQQLKEKLFSDIKRDVVDRGRTHENIEDQLIFDKKVLNKKESRKENIEPINEDLNESIEIRDKQFVNQLFHDSQTAGDMLKMKIEEIYINNAGLILLWPFLGRLFAKLKFHSAEGWSADNGRDKAIQLLQYLATGSSDFNEHDLTLNKILCGSDIFYPTQPRILLVETDKVEGDSLIKAVIANWSVLKNTSIEGFRISFLQREGRLTLEDSGWKLYIERKGYDVLLDKLPWAISVIKNEWMPKPIYTEW